MRSKHVAARRTAKRLLGLVLISAVLQTLIAWCCQSHARQSPRTLPRIQQGISVAEPLGWFHITIQEWPGSTVVAASFTRASITDVKNERTGRGFEAVRSWAERSNIQLPSWGPFSNLGKIESVTAFTQPGIPLRQVAMGVPFRSLYYVQHKPQEGQSWWRYAGGYEVPPFAAKMAGLRPHEAVLPWRPLWLGLLANTLIYASVPLLVMLISALRHDLRLRRNRCPSCGYSLAGQIVPGCPECGWKRIERIGDAAP